MADGALKGPHEVNIVLLTGMETQVTEAKPRVQSHAANSKTRSRSETDSTGILTHQSVCSQSSHFAGRKTGLGEQRSPRSPGPTMLLPSGSTRSATATLPGEASPSAAPPHSPRSPCGGNGSYPRCPKGETAATSQPGEVHPKVTQPGLGASLVSCKAGVLGASVKVSAQGQKAQSHVSKSHRQAGGELPEG